MMKTITSNLDAYASDLPPIVNAVNFTTDKIERPPELIHGVLHKGSKGVYGGPSKSCKTWTLLNAAITVAHGIDWLGFCTTQGKTLYINFELQEFAVQDRISAICHALDVDIPSNMDVWNLRGYARQLTKLIPELIPRIEGEGYSLIIPDPIYKTLEGRSENDNGAVGEVCNEIEKVAVETGAAVMYGAHFAKGNSAVKDAIDRISGGGVWARDPDAIMVATQHEEDNTFTLEMILRNFPKPEPFCIRWDYPLMLADFSLDPTALKGKVGRPFVNKVEDILKYLASPLKISVWQKTCLTEGGVSRPTFYRLRKVAEKNGLIVRSVVDNKWRVK